MSKKNVLFLCTGNSCRSQMAEAITGHFRHQSWVAFSAGTDPAGYVHPKARQALEEIGIQWEGVSKNVSSLRERDFDLVITVCDQATRNCPVWLGKGEKRHIGFQDPAQAQGSEEEVLAVFREVRDQIINQILIELDRFLPQAVGKREAK